MHSFKIALLEELNEEQICPGAAYLERLRWIGDVRHVEHEFDQKFLVFMIAWLETRVCQSTAQMPKLIKVFSHVSIYDCKDYDLTTAFKIFTSHLTLPLAGRVFHQLEGGCKVIIF